MNTHHVFNTQYKSFHQLINFIKSQRSPVLFFQQYTRNNLTYKTQLANGKSCLVKNETAYEFAQLFNVIIHKFPITQ